MKFLMLLETNKQIDFASGWINNGHIEACCVYHGKYLTKGQGFVAAYEQLTITSIYDVHIKNTEWFVED